MRRLERANRYALIPCLMVAGVSCREESDTAKPSKIAHEEKVELTFPEALHTADKRVNEFVQTALNQCAQGEYEGFRSLWTARQEPISRAEFHEGWNAVERVEVKALEKALLALDGDSDDTVPVYVLLVEVGLDSSARVGQQKPVREIVLMLVLEHEQWRLAGAPKEMRDWVKAKLAAPDMNDSPEKIDVEQGITKPPAKQLTP